MKMVYATCARMLGCLLMAAWVMTGVGCESGGGGISNDDPGDNDVNVYVAIGDSITAGSECNCTPYPQQLSSMIGKTVHNQGSPGEQSSSCAGRTPRVIERFKPGFMLILTGVNDVIHRRGADSIVGNVRSIVRTCKDSHVVPVVATYPIPSAGHAAFSGGTITLNRLLREMADQEGAYLVDLETEFGDTPDLMMPDGLHPNATGTALMALAFKDLIQ